MELRQRVRAASASASAHFGRKPVADDPHAISFWLCEGHKKKSVYALKTASLESALADWNMFSVLDDPELHFMNEATGIVVPRSDEIGAYISDRDVVRLCSSDELPSLLNKFATRDSDVDAEIHGSGHKSLSEKLGKKLRKMGNSNSTLKRIQQKFDDHVGTSHHSTDDADPTDRFVETDPVFESSDTEELPEDTPPKCDMCDVSWPDDATGRMHKLHPLGLITHQGCAQFAVDVLARNPQITTREQIIHDRDATLAEVNQPGTFYVTVLRAMDLPGVQLLGTQAPYAKLSLLPWKEPVQTKPSDHGGRNPVWKAMHNNRVQLSHMYNSTITPIPLLEVEIWNSNYLSDDLVACTLVDMTPLLRYPHVVAKRWFSLSSRVQAPLAMISPATGQAKVLLGIQFVPIEGVVASGNEHKFRVHQLKSIGLAIPNCAVCDRVIVNVLKHAWGYRCEYCSIDVHKGCIMKAMTRCKCKRLDVSSNTRDSVTTQKQQQQQRAKRIERRGVAFRVLPPADNASRLVGELFVNLQGLHICTKQCNLETNVHAKNIFDGDTYCRLVFEDVVHETSPVLKSADPMVHEAVCFQSRFRNSNFKLEVIDFNSDACIGEMAITLFQLLQRDADRFVRSDPLLQQLRGPLRRLALAGGGSSAVAAMHSHAANGMLDDLLSVPDTDRYELFAPSSKSRDDDGGSDRRKPVGYALLRAEYVEAKSDLMRMRLDEDNLLLAREVQDVTVESLRLTVDRFSRVVRTFQYADMTYDHIISWKDKRTSSVCLVTFVCSCVFVNLEYIGAYILGGVLLYMLYELHLRLEGAFQWRWIGFEDYDAEQIELLKLHRPLADLRVAVHDAVISDATHALLLKSQAALKDAASMRLYVRITYRPNDHPRPQATGVGRRGGTRFIPSGYDETIVAWTHAVEKSRHPVWRHVAAEPTTSSSSASSSSSSATSSSSFAASFLSKPKKEQPFRNFNISWRHDAAHCSCMRCVATQWYRKSNLGDANAAASGVDHHAFYFPIPQACRKNFTNRDDLVPWRLFPGLLRFELCGSLSGDAKETPDIVVATGTIPLKDVRHSVRGGNQELTVELSTVGDSASDDTAAAPASAASLAATESTELSDTDQLRVRIDFDVPSSHVRDQQQATAMQPRARRDSTDDATAAGGPSTPEIGTGTISGMAATALASTVTMPLLESLAPRRVSRAERSVSESVCESLAAKETSSSSAVLGGHLLDAFWKIKDTLRSVQNSISAACGTVASAENLLNWTHPWKTATAFAVVALAAIVFAFIPGRWLLLAFGVSEFAAGFIEDLPPSNHVRNVFWNFLSSVPTDQDLLAVYERERETYAQRQRAQQERDSDEALRLRLHALWVGAVQSKGENDRSYKSYFMAYRPFRFVLWKSVEDAESGAVPYLQLIFERAEAIVSKIDDSSFVFHVFGVTSSGSDEKRSFSFESFETKELLQQIIQQSCNAS